MPSPAAASTSTPSARSLVTIATSPSRAASMSGSSPQANAERDSPSKATPTHVPTLLDAVASPVWCLQNRALGPDPAFAAVTQVHAASDAGLAAWASTVEADGATVVVVGVSEHETETPWN